MRNPASCPVVHFEVMGRSGPELAKFYASTFGWKIGDAVGPQDYALVDADPELARGIRGGIGTAPEGYGGGATFYIGVSNIGAAFEEIERNGGTRMRGPDVAPGGIVLGYFRDPDGHPIGLVEIPPP